MDVEFRSRRLQQRYIASADAIRAWGPTVGSRYVERVKALVAAETIKEIRDVRAYDLHRLAGDRAGQYAIRLTGQVRLILTVGDEQRVMVEEVVDYHG